MCHAVVWCLQDAKRSDPMDGFCQLFGVPRWLSKATRLMAGLEITLSGDMLVVKQVRQPKGIVARKLQRICCVSICLCGGCLERNQHVRKLTAFAKTQCSCKDHRFLQAASGLLKRMACWSSSACCVPWSCRFAS
jgi:hypothetical protein